MAPSCAVLDQALRNAPLLLHLYHVQWADFLAEPLQLMGKPRKEVPCLVPHILVALVL